MEVDPTRVCDLLVGLGDVEVLGVGDVAGDRTGVDVDGVHFRARRAEPHRWRLRCLRLHPAPSRAPPAELLQRS